METQAQLLSEIESFLSTRKMAETTFGRMAVNDGKFVSRLRNGANMTLATIDRARTYIKGQNVDSVQSHDGEAA
jgi:TnpA family transposase